MRSIGVLSDHHAAVEADLVVPSLDVLPSRAFDDLLARA
jgi:hypothetical protein